MAGGLASKLVCSRAALTGLRDRWTLGRDTSNPYPRTRNRRRARRPAAGCPPTRCELCAHCAAVYAAAVELYDQLAAREMARLELEHPGLEHAARIALRAAERRTAARASAPARDLSIARSAGRAPLREWQIARLEQFVGQLRTLTSDAGGPV